MKRPRVLIVGPRLDLGGAEIHLSRVLPRLRQAGLDVSLFTIERGGRLEPLFEAAEVPVLGLRGSGWRLIRDLRAARALRSEIRRRKPDIVHFFLAEPYLLGALATAGLNGFMQIMSRRSLSLYQRNYPFLAAIERRLHRRMRALIGNSNNVAAELVEESGRFERVGVIHNGIDLPAVPTVQTRAERRRELGIPGDAFVIAVVANLISYKGHADLIDGLGGISTHLGEGWRLLLIGRDDGLRAALRAQAEPAGIGAHILWLGELSDPQHALAAADIGVLPSHEEGFSNSLIEKMAQGLAVVATRVGGNTDAVVDGASGLLVSAREPAALAAAILRLHDEPALRERLGADARARVERLFSIELCARRYLRLYRGLISSDRPVAELIDPRIERPVAVL